MDELFVCALDRTDHWFRLFWRRVRYFQRLYPLPSLDLFLGIFTFLVDAVRLRSEALCGEKSFTQLMFSSTHHTQPACGRQLLYAMLLRRGFPLVWKSKFVISFVNSTHVVANKMPFQRIGTLDISGASSLLGFLTLAMLPFP